MRDDPRIHVAASVPSSSVSRRVMLSSAAKLAGGAALAGAIGVRWAGLAAAQEEIVLTAAFSEVGARPGAAYAQGYVALAAADSGSGATAGGASGGSGAGAGPGDSSGAGPGDQSGTGGGGTGGGTGAGSGDGGGGGGGGSGAGPGDQTGTGGGDQMPPAGG